MNIFANLFQHASSYGSRSSILSIWIWVLGMLGMMLLYLSGAIGINNWIIISLFILLVIVILVLIGIYSYCLYTGKTDFLRSEKFVIEKMVIEKQISGDSLTGIHEDSPITQIRAITVQEDEE